MHAKKGYDKDTLSMQVFSCVVIITNISGIFGAFTNIFSSIRNGNNEIILLFLGT